MRKRAAFDLTAVIAAALLLASGCGGSPNPTPPARGAEPDAASDQPTTGDATTGSAADAPASAPGSDGPGGPGTSVTDASPGDDTGARLAADAQDALAATPPLAPELPLDLVKAAVPEPYVRIAGHPEGPSWRDGDLFFVVDGRGLLRAGADQKIYRYHPQIAATGSFLLADRSLLVCEHTRTLVQIAADGKVDRLATSGSCNDVTVDGAGNIYFSDFSPSGGVYRLTPDGQQTKPITGLPNPNGLEVDPASQYLYILAGAGDVLRVPLVAGVPMGAPEKVASLGGLPDGCAFDAWGNLWMAVWSPGKIAIFDPKKMQIIATIDGGAPMVTNLTFGGPQRDELYTTADNKGVFRIPVKARGFAGHPGAAHYTSKGAVNATPVNTPL
jgi:sugar lactone lactonase YvrE